MTDKPDRARDFYLYTDGAQYGPYTLDELRGKPVGPDTLLWFTGAKDWMPVNSVDELTAAIRGAQPASQGAVRHVPAMSARREHRMSDGGSHAVSHRRQRYRAIALVMAGLALIALSAALTHMYDQRQSASLADRAAMQDSIILAQGNRIRAFEQAEIRRRQEEARKRRQQRLQTLNLQYDDALIRLRAAQDELEDIREFHFLRSESEKEAQIRGQLEEIRTWERAVADIKAEIDRT